MRRLGLLFFDEKKKIGPWKLCHELRSVLQADAICADGIPFRLRRLIDCATRNQVTIAIVRILY